jgi:DNA-binding transcriptional LysR family regulator
MLDFELLRAFVAVADCGGFHRAAKRLNLTALAGLAIAPLAASARIGRASTV